MLLLRVPVYRAWRRGTRLDVLPLLDTGARKQAMPKPTPKPKGEAGTKQEKKEEQEKKDKSKMHAVICPDI